MDLQLVKRGFDFGRKRKKWVFVLTALGFTGYGAYRVYNSPSVAKKRRRFLKLLGALVSMAESVSDSAESIGILSKDLREFLHSDSDQIPNSLKQLSKIAMSDELASSFAKLTQALTMGVLSGYRIQSERAESGSNSGFSERVLDRVFSPAGSGLASAVAGSFARNLVIGFYSRAGPGDPGQVPEWVDIVLGEKSRDLIGGCIEALVSTAVSVYLEKTMEVNAYDELFSGLTNPRHEARVKEILASVCNGAVETLVRTSHQVLTRPGRPEDPKTVPETDESDSEDDGDGSGPGWAGRVSSTLAVPSNRRLVLDVTGRVTFETVRSVLEFLVEKLYEGARGCANAVYEAGLGAVRFVAVKSSVIATICLSLCLHAAGSTTWLLMPA